MTKSIPGALMGARLFAVVLPVRGLLLGWFKLDRMLLVVGGGGASAGGLLGWRCPVILLTPIRIFLEPNLFD